MAIDSPLFTVPGLPRHIDLIRHADCFVLRCGRCGEQERHGLPVMSSELRRVAGEFAAEHGHENEPQPGLKIRGEAIHITCWRCGNEDQSRFRHVWDEPENGGVEVIFECLDCETLISDWFEVEETEDD